MTRRTSAETYKTIERDGLLSSLRFVVYTGLYRHGPMTLAELCRKMSSISERSITPRFAELRKLGVIEEIGERVCTVTGRKVIEWDVTDSLPGKLKARTKSSVIHACSGCQRYFDINLKHYDSDGQMCLGTMKKYKECNK